MNIEKILEVHTMPVDVDEDGEFSCSCGSKLAFAVDLEEAQAIWRKHVATKIYEHVGERIRT